MIPGDLGKAKLNLEMAEAESRLPPYGRAEKKAARQAERAEEAFRATRGSPAATLWGRIRRHFKKQKQ